MAAKTGGCLCGAVRFSAAEVEQHFGACHCRMCQHWAGGPFLAASAKGVQFEGEEHLVRHQSSDWAERGFCGRCGSALFYKILASDDYEMCIGAFDDTGGFVLRNEIFVDRKPDAYAFAGDHERLTEAETIARYKDFGS
jgi:hypothetical protein